MESGSNKGVSVDLPTWSMPNGDIVEALAGIGWAHG